MQSGFFMQNIMKNKITILLICLVACTNSKRSSSEHLENLGKLIGTGNWQVLNGADTLYVFFSQQVNHSYKIYTYTFSKGDSANTKMESIVQNKNGVEWNFLDKKLVLKQNKKDTFFWVDPDQNEYVLQKNNDSTLQMQTPEKKIVFKKTLPLSTFMIRVKYDYEHGSTLKDSSEIKPRKQKQ